jgi:glycosyltransferase involved in cell wall biosynthesis
MAVLEAMASGCAVLATTLPLANVHMLAEGRGITVPPGDAVETSKALVRLLNDPDLCHRMGKLARDYVAVRHSASEFRRVLRRATYWSAPGAGLECREK